MTDYVKVYRNLNKKCWSVKSKDKPVQHFDQLVLEACTFHVGKKGRERVLREQRKNVHAYVKGILLNNCNFMLPVEVSYDPYKFDYFYKIDSNMPINKCCKAKFTKTGYLFVSIQ